MYKGQKYSKNCWMFINFSSGEQFPKERIEMMILWISIDRCIPKLFYFQIETIFLEFYFTFF